jgi:hypothetical protein
MQKLNMAKMFMILLKKLDHNLVKLYGKFWDLFDNKNLDEDEMKLLLFVNLITKRQCKGIRNIAE